MMLPLSRWAYMPHGRDCWEQAISRLMCSWTDESGWGAASFITPLTASWNNDTQWGSL